MTIEPNKMQPKEFDILIRLIEVHLNKIKGEKDINDLAGTEPTKQNSDVLYFGQLIEKVRHLKSEQGKPEKLESLAADELIFRKEAKVIKRVKFIDEPSLLL